MTTITTGEARIQFADLINKAAFGKENIIVTRRGKKIAAIVPIETLELLDKMENESDIREAKAVLKEKGGIKLTDLKIKLGLQ